MGGMFFGEWPLVSRVPFEHCQAWAGRVDLAVWLFDFWAGCVDNMRAPKVQKNLNKTVAFMGGDSTMGSLVKFFTSEV